MPSLRRKVVWFQPPQSQTVVTPVSRARPTLCAERSRRMASSSPRWTSSPRLPSPGIFVCVWQSIRPGRSVALGKLRTCSSGGAGAGSGIHRRDRPPHYPHHDIGGSSRTGPIENPPRADGQRSIWLLHGGTSFSLQGKISTPTLRGHISPCAPLTLTPSPLPTQGTTVRSADALRLDLTVTSA